MPKNIALFIDGTWNRRDTPNKANTNVAKLHDLAKAASGNFSFVGGVPVADPMSPQVVHYLRGVGTRNRISAAIGGPTGFGSARRIREAYLFLALNYQRGDNVFLFGFSRGAFAARALAGFVGKVGLLFREEARRQSVARAYELYERWSWENARFVNAIVDHIGLPAGVVGDQAPIPVWLIGVWDTVKRLGVPAGALHIGKGAYHDHVQLPRHVSHARHALALHDLRPEFEPTIWEDWVEPQTLEQVWFRGAHSDVGGGYADATQSDISLSYMAQEAQRLGLGLHGSPPNPSESSRFVHLALLPPFIGGSLQPRQLLAGALSLSPRVRESFWVHRTACDRLLRPDDTDIVPERALWQRLRSSVVKRHAREVYRNVDELTLRLQAHLAVTLSRLPRQ